MRTDQRAESDPSRVRTTLARIANVHGYGPAFAALAAAIAFHYLILRLFSPNPNLTVVFFGYLAAVVIAAWCGYGPGVLVVLIGSIGIPFLFRRGFSLSSLNTPGIVSLALISLLISHTSGVRRKSERNLKALNDDLDRRVRERTQDLARLNTELETARDSLRATLASIGDAVISTDTEGRVRFANGVALKLLRLTESEVVGRLLDEVFRIVNEFTRAPVENPVVKVLRDGAIVGLANHTVLIAADGTEIPIDDSGAPIRSADGRLQGTVLVFRDITERRRADNTRQLLASIVENSNDAIISKDLNGIVTSWNKAAERLFGYTAEEMIGKPISTIAPDSRKDEMATILKRIQRGERIEHFETIRKKKSGELLPVSITVSPVVNSAGIIVGASKISRDISESVRAAEQLKQLNAELQRTNETLAAANEDLERFAFIASHDLQEPLRMVTAYSQLLVRSFSGQLDPAASQYVAYIVEATGRMRDLIADLLAYTEIRAGVDEPQEIVDLNTVVGDVRKSLHTAIEESGATVISERLPHVRVHRRHIQSVFQNLISNAIKYRGNEPPVIRVSARTVGGELRFEVSDNGIGIEPEYHKHIFEVFRRLHGKRIPGTGIGLAICERVVERYGGKIGVESQPGQGSTFWFTLPETALASAEDRA